MTAPPSAVVAALRALTVGERLHEREVTAAFDAIMAGDATPAQVGALLVGLRLRGEDAEQIAGVARALRNAMVAVTVLPGTAPVDTCGTGGGTVSTFNISTASALVTAACGVRVAKHGNRSHTSRCGSADVLEALGVPLAEDAETASRILAACGITFLFAPTFHPAMRYVGPVRRELGVPTVMNLVGPLANPAGVRRQVLGVADPAVGPTMASALGRLGAEHAVVVHGAAGLDEIAPVGETVVWELQDGDVREWRTRPDDLGERSIADPAVLAGGEPDDNAARIERLLTSPGDDPDGAVAVVLNAGFAVYVGGAASNPREGVRIARAGLENGAALDVLDRLRRAARTS
jgi:anthranilate phosphoribosyltransferase